MTTPIIDHHIDHPSAWKSRDFKSQDDYAIDLEPRHIKALDAALGDVRKAGLGIDDITKASFPLDGIQDLIDQVSHELIDGRGFLMIRGWPLDQYSLEDIGVMYYGFGAHFGKGASQSVIGDRLGYVMDHSDSEPLERAYRNKHELSLHTDFNELIGMLNIRQAARASTPARSPFTTRYSRPDPTYWDLCTKASTIIGAAKRRLARSPLPRTRFRYFPASTGC